MSAFDQLDRTDYEILRLLRNNARLSNRELAEQIGLAPSTTLVRVRRLEREGAIRGYVAEFAPEALGVSLQAMIAVKLQHHSLKDLSAFRQHVLSLEEVVQIYHIAGASDFLIHVWVRDAQHLRDLAMVSLTTRPEVAQLETHLIFEHTRNAEMPLYVNVDAD
ncbi:ArsR family transcriptional regulator [Halioglobus japonicus]|uniref:Lrp/AsnC family transcriptional regulator n=1 Tax=Halioglobus japonicus TaxID=930805 RepID=A0AAP8MF37_9GAMM|nr:MULTISPECIES: Lrp/AsnC family transcriptional regulator [Halioglobus]AQA18622.1 ArsR family transcriptional regulator [Halioglobus japonicus]KZX58718.1 ArsR family transcriptional regulator [Halioglobus sp. HI00S01]PLW86646.1 Lrp/AsnC family transcriptional regulator [Halioglobus japonicus]GHD11786.1 AsnC family transcriptional regulator [Halioglobus japonicus]